MPARKPVTSPPMKINSSIDAHAVQANQTGQAALVRRGGSGGDWTVIGAFRIIKGALMRFKSFLKLAKIRLTAMVLVTTAVGFILGSVDVVDYARLCWTILGTGLAAAGAS